MRSPSIPPRDAAQTSARTAFRAIGVAAIALDATDYQAERDLRHPKSRAGERRVPIPRTLRHHLLARCFRQGNPSEGFVFANSHGRPFDPATILTRARKAWSTAELQPITLHECRHTYAAFMIAAGINAKALSTYMGHTSITVTLDRYGHLLPGNEYQAAHTLDTWLKTQQDSAAQLPGA